MTLTLKIHIPDRAFATLRQDPEGFAHELRLAAAVKWYEMGTVSQGRGAEIAGLSRATFLEALGRYGVSPFQTTPEELDQEIGRCLGRRSPCSRTQHSPSPHAPWSEQ